MRIKEHLKSILKFQPYIKFTPVSNHFNLNDHSIKDFSFFVYEINLDNDFKRKFIERKLIKLLKDNNVKLINIDFSSIYSNNYQILL